MQKRKIHAAIHSLKEDNLSRSFNSNRNSSSHSDFSTSLRKPVNDQLDSKSTNRTVIVRRIRLGPSQLTQDPGCHPLEKHVSQISGFSSEKALQKITMDNRSSPQTSTNYMTIRYSEYSRSDLPASTDSIHDHGSNKFEASSISAGKSSAVDWKGFKHNLLNQNHKKRNNQKQKWRKRTPFLFLCLGILIVLLGTLIAAVVLATRNNSPSVQNIVTTNATTPGPVTYQPKGIFNLRIPSCAIWNTTGTTVAGNQNGTRGADLTSIDSPVTIFVDNNNTLYVADRDNHRIMKYYENSNVSIIVAGNGTNGSTISELSEPKGVAVDQQGNVIVGDSLNYRIQKFLAGLTIGTTIASNSSSFIIGHIRDLQIDVNNNIYVTDSDFSRILRFSAFNGAASILAGQNGTGNGPAQLNGPFGTFVSNNQTLYIADGGNHRIQMWEPGATTGVTVAGTTGSAGSTSFQFRNPYAVVVDQNGHIFVADYNNHRIMKWTSNYSAGGQCIVGCSGTAGNNPTQLRGPRDLKFDAQGNLYVSDQGNNRVQKFGIVYPANCTTSG